jgi:hypothetical protein
MNLLRLRLFNKLRYMRGWCAEGIFAFFCSLIDLLLLDRRCLGEAVAVAVSFCSPSEQIVKKLNFAV